MTCKDLRYPYVVACVNITCGDDDASSCEAAFRECVSLVLGHPNHEKGVIYQLGEGGKCLTYLWRCGLHYVFTMVHKVAGDKNKYEEELKGKVLDHFPKAKVLDVSVKLAQQLKSLMTDDRRIPENFPSGDECDFTAWYDNDFCPADKKGDADIRSWQLSHAMSASEKHPTDPRYKHVLERHEDMRHLVKEVPTDPARKRSYDPIICGEFTYRNSDFLGYDFVSVERGRDQFYMTVNVVRPEVKDPESWFPKTQRDAAAIGFTLRATNGSVKDLRDAIAATGHLWS